jgi:hypothetical protein
MLEHQESGEPDAGEITAALARWLENGREKERGLIPYAPKGGRRRVAEDDDGAALAALRLSLAGMEQRLSIAAHRHDDALSQLRARLDTLRASVSKVSDDQFANGHTLNQLLGRLATRIKLLEEDGRPAGRRSWFRRAGG